MASGSEAKTKTSRKKGAKSVVREYFDALNDQDIERALETWKPGGMDRIHGLAELEAPYGIRAYFSELFAAFPDWRFEVVELIASGEIAAARWRIEASFSGPGRFRGLAPTGGRIELEGADVFRVVGEQIVENNGYTNGAYLAQQLGLLPASGSTAERAMTRAFNAKTAAADALRKLRDR